MRRLIVCKGLSFSGKTTWANEEAERLGNCVVVTKDDIRKELGRVKEGKVIKRRNELIVQALKEGKNVISADTNLSNKVNHIAAIKGLLASLS